VHLSHSPLENTFGKLDDGSLDEWIVIFHMSAMRMMP
jgi:hypothetical protein